MVASSGARPNVKRSADEFQPPTSTSAADAAQGMEEGTTQGQDGPSNRSGGGLHNGMVGVLGANFCRRDHEKQDNDSVGVRADDVNFYSKTKRPRAGAVWTNELDDRQKQCYLCDRVWKSTACRKNLVCQWCAKGPLCNDCKMGPLCIHCEVGPPRQWFAMLPEDARPRASLA